MSRSQCHCEHEFTLALTGVDDFGDEALAALYEADCDDATFAIRSGRPFATFSRTAASLKDAILGAIRDIRRANVGLDVLRVDYCNLVTQSDIARRIGRTRQAVHQYMLGTRGPGGFPGPVCEVTEGNYLWSWCEVAYWLWENDIVSEEVLRVAEEVEMINTALELHRQKKHRPEVAAEVLRGIGVD